MARLFGKGKDEPSGSGSNGSHFAGSRGRSSRNGDEAVLPEDLEIEAHPVPLRLLPAERHASLGRSGRGERPGAKFEETLVDLADV